MQTRQYYVYIVTNNLIKRIYQYRIGIGSSFTSKYKINKLVYCEIYDDVNEAIKREKQIKAGSRKKKIILIELMKLDWKDLYDDIIK